MSWQLQDAKQRFSELVRRAETEGPQVVTRHGRDVVVVISSAEFREVRGEAPDFKQALLAHPGLAPLEIRRRRSRSRRVQLPELTDG